MKNQTMSDEVLISRYITDSCGNSIKVLINRHSRLLFRYIFNMVKDRELAHDLYQETFMKVLVTMKSGKYNEEGKFIQWLMRIAHNCIIDYFRKDSKMPKVRDTEEFNLMATLRVYDKNAEELIVKEQIHSDLRKLVDTLPKQQREVLKMRIYQEMSFKDIAEQTNVSINTALGRMRYALLNLKKKIKDHNIILTP